MNSIVKIYAVLDINTPIKITVDFSALTYLIIFMLFTLLIIQKMATKRQTSTIKN